MPHLISCFLIAGVIAAQTPGRVWSPVLPYPLTDAERANARALAEKVLVEELLPAAERSREFYHLSGIEIKDPRLGEPFLEAGLRGRSLDDYLDSAENDPRLFASVLKYGFPVYVSGRTEPIISIIVARKCDENRNKFHADEGDIVFAGYYFGGPGRTEEATRLRDRFGGAISFVEFVDAIITTVMVEETRQA